MASGKLGSSALTAGALTQVYAGPPSGSVATANICLVNVGTVPVVVRIAISTSSTAAGVAAADYISYGIALNANDEYERTGVVVGNGESVWIWASNSGVSARLHGFEGAG